MKNLVLPILLLSLALFTQCKKDPATSSDNIVGTWSVKTINCADCKSVSVGQGLTTTFAYTLTGKDIVSTLTFGADGKMTSTGSYTAVLDGDIDGIPYYQEVPSSQFSNTGNYVRNGNELTVTQSTGEVQTGTISNETSNACTFSYKINEVRNQNGITTTVSGTTVYTLERQ